jgi:hypothetical protein
MSGRIKIYPTPEERIAAVAMGTIRHFARAYRRLPDIADLREDLRVHVVREIMLGKLEGLRVRREKSDEVIRKLIIEIANQI